MRKLLRFPWVIILTMGVLFFSCKEDYTVEPPKGDNQGIDTTVISSDFTLPSKFVGVNGKQIHYVEDGSGDETFLLIHGIPSNLYLWRNVIPHLRADGRVIAMDMAGWGQSEKLASQEMSWASQTAYIESFIDQLKLKNIILVIHDVSVAFGIDIAKRRPDLVKGLVFFEGPLAPVPRLADIPNDIPSFTEQFKKVYTGIEGDTTKNSGWDLIIKQNNFSNQIMNDLIFRELPTEVVAAYNAPFATENDRLIIWRSMRGVPVADQLNNLDSVRRLENEQNSAMLLSNFNWLQTSTIPKLTFYATPGFAFTNVVAPLLESLPNTKAIKLENNIHYYQEDSPHRIGLEISQWTKNNF